MILSLQRPRKKTNGICVFSWFCSCPALHRNITVERTSSRFPDWQQSAFPLRGNILSSNLLSLTGFIPGNFELKWAWIFTQNTFCLGVAAHPSSQFIGLSNELKKARTGKRGIYDHVFKECITVCKYTTAKLRLQRELWFLYCVCYSLPLFYYSSKLMKTAASKIIRNVIQICHRLFMYNYNYAQQPKTPITPFCKTPTAKMGQSHIIITSNLKASPSSLKVTILKYPYLKK